MDVIALAQFGIHYAVAALGTAVSQAHFDLLFRFSSELVFCFDGDKAGREATWRAMESAFSSLKDGRQIRIVLLPQHHDPDSLIREEGVNGFIARIDSSQTLSEHFFGHLLNELNLSEIEGRAQLVLKAKPYIDKLPDSVFKEMMFARLKELSGWTSLDVLENPATLGFKQNAKHVAITGRGQHKDKGRLTSARVAIALLVQNPRLAELIEQREIDREELEFSGASLFKNILQMIQDNNPINQAVLMECYRGTTEEKSIKALALLDVQVPDDKIDTVFCDSLDRLLIQSKEIILARLLDKSKTEGLNAQEKELLRKMLAVKKYGAK
jgi:DNA primase